MVGLVFLYIILFIALLIVNASLASRFEQIAAEKGFSDKAYFWWCFFMGIAGYLMVVALPDRECEETSNNTGSSDSWKCKKCGNINKNYCGTCGCGNTKDEN